MIIIYVVYSVIYPFAYSLASTLQNTPNYKMPYFYDSFHIVCKPYIQSWTSHLGHKKPLLTLNDNSVISVYLLHLLQVISLRFGSASQITCLLEDNVIISILCHMLLIMMFAQPTSFLA